MARTYLDARDRVGMVFFGERMRWLAPGMGDRQFFRLMDAVLAGRAGWSSGNDITRLPRAALPPGAAVIAFSPLLDPKFIETLRDLRQRGFSVIVVDVLEVVPTGDPATSWTAWRSGYGAWNGRRSCSRSGNWGSPWSAGPARASSSCRRSAGPVSPQGPAGEVHRRRGPPRRRLHSMGGRPVARDGGAWRGPALLVAICVAAGLLRLGT